MLVMTTREDDKSHVRLQELGIDLGKCYLLGSPLSSLVRHRRARSGQPCDIPIDDRWAHVAAALPGGMIIDCHTDEAGVICYSWEDLLTLDGKMDVWAVEYPYWNHLQLSCMLGVKTSVPKLLRYWRMRHGEYIQPIVGDDGTTCSELLAYADGFNICRFAKKPPCDIVPIHYQQWAQDKELIQVTRKESV